MSVPDPLPEIHLSNLGYTTYHWLTDWRNRDGDEPHGFFDLTAPYQRGSVWSTEQRQNLIKSLLIGVPVGVIIMSALPYSEDRPDFRIVDGKQRIEAVNAFARDEFSIPGHWLHEDCVVDPSDRARDLHYSEMSDTGRRGFTGTKMPCLEFNPHRVWHGRDAKGENIWTYRTEAEMLQAEAELYLLVNFGGVAQTDADLARATSVANVTLSTLDTESN